MAILNAEQIFAAKDLPTDKVSVPEWGGEVCIRTLTGTERDAWEASLLQQKGDKREANLENLRAKLVTICAIDEKGNPLFSELDAARLGASKSAKALNRVFEAAQKLNGMGQHDVEELVANFPNGDGSSSGSPVASE